MGEIDDFALKHNGTIYQTEDWIKFKGFKPVILRIDNAIKGIFFNGGASPLTENMGFIPELFDMAEAKNKSVKFTVNQLNPFFKEICLEAIGRGYEFAPFFNLVKTIEQDEKTMWMGLDKKTRNCIRKAELNNIKIIEVPYNEENRKIYHEIHKDMSIRAGIKPQTMTYFDNINLIKNKKMLFAYHDNNAIGGIIILYFNNYAHIFKSASLAKYLKMKPNDILWWSAIKDCQKNGIRYLDLGGGMLKSYIEFKNGFSPDLVVSIIFSKYKNIKSKPYKFLKLMQKAYEIKILGD